MAINRDYKKSGNGNKGGNSMVTGIVIGVFIGLTIALVVALYVTNAPTPFKGKEQTPAQPPNAAKPAPAQTGKPAATPDQKDAKDQKKFTFYDILPGTEQPVSEQDLRQAPQSAKDRYFLQAGSFQNESDANNLKAKLALMGVEATIESTNLPDKGVWHRVRVGPFADVEEMSKTRVTLSQNGIQPTLIKVQDAKH